MKYVHSADGNSIMFIQELDQKIEPVHHLQKAWVNIYGVPFEIRSFLPLWAVGTIIGATQKVDLRYTKRMGVVRLLVGVTNVDKIPESVDIVVGDGLYEIFFKVDKVCKDGVWSNFNYPSDKNDEDENDSKGEEYDGLDDFQNNREATGEDAVMDDVSGKNVDNSSNVIQASQQVQEFSKTDLSLDNSDAVVLSQTTAPVFFYNQGPNLALGDAASKGYELDAGAIDAHVATENANVSALESACVGMADKMTVALAHMQTATPNALELGSDQTLAQHSFQAAANVCVGLVDFSMGSDHTCVEGDDFVNPSIGHPKHTYSRSLINVEADPFISELNISGQGDLNTMPFSLVQSGGTSDTSFSFSEVPRATLQHLCKLFKIKANMKNDEMVQALQHLARTDNHVLVALQDWFTSKSLSQRPTAVEAVTRASSKRVASDEDIMSKAQRLVAKRNLEISECSFVSFKSKIITTNLNNVGIRLGRNDNEVLKSVEAIKNMEVDRLIVSTNSSSSVHCIDLDKEEEDEIDTHLSNASKRWDDNSDQDGLEWGYHLSVVSRRKKANHFTSVRRASRPSKKPVTLSKISLK